MINTPQLDVQHIEDKYIQDNFRKLNSYLQNLTNFLGFRHLEIVINGAVAGLKYPHNLGFTPKDLVQTSKVGAGNITYNYDLFDSTNLNITATGACTVRVYVGTHVEGTLT